jgi:uncharacterized RDD family membrane protein YckC
MTIADSYIERVLAFLPSGTPQREQIAMELRGHIAERLEGGQTMDEVLRQLGDPQALAQSYLSAVPLELPPHGDRIAAKLLDISSTVAIVGAIILVAWLSLAWDIFIVVCIAAIFAGSFGFFIYTIAAEHGSGQTIGKRRFGLQVVTEAGSPISLGQAIVRQLPVVFQVGWIDVLFALFTDRRQRAFELLSKTRVVRASRRPDRT